MDLSWFRARGYRHFDNPIALSGLADLLKPDAVSKHAFSPLIHQIAETRRYKPGEHKTVTKARPIMYSSHLDAAILGYYSNDINAKLSSYYDDNSLSENVIAYRSLGRANYHFSSEVHNFATEKSPCTILAFDVTGFFDNLNHARLKARLKTLLRVSELPPDWYNIFRYLTKFRYVQKEDLLANPILKARLTAKDKRRICTVAELKKLGILLRPNGTQLNPPRSPNVAGIPQGTPISASISNAYMIDFDKSMKHFCDGIGALYRRYSDDILVVCGREHKAAVEAHVKHELLIEKLEISANKTEITDFPSAVAGSRAAQYLGFAFHPEGPAIRPSSISRQARKIRKAVRKAKSSASKGNGVLHTRKLRKRFRLTFDMKNDRPIRNFPAYARRSADAFGKGQKVIGQALKLERLLEKEIARARKELT